MRCNAMIFQLLFGHTPTCATMEHFESSGELMKLVYGKLFIILHEICLE